ncbi:hypothetical protein J2W25_004601 [Variovorax boronicumulans]|uniref:Replication protein n=1 Tax=Variovorax boronicumulans TaxID=436515 RepID=A0AAW8E0X3_9BURK|nr:hypothetical protein [Variovorax boronicumulans]MDP9880273.1 hypothetical protein [Variovorax boronicumulans]MDP9925558.1 hypothetical protein [Variovorax boronicumulans]
MNTNTVIRQSPGFIDKLAYLLPTLEALGPEIGWLPAFQAYVGTGIATGRCKPAFGVEPRFRGSAQLLLPSGAQAFVSYGRKGKKQKRFGIRVECNPGRMTATDVAAVHSFFLGAFGNQYLEMLKAPRIKRLDLAVDIKGLELDDVYVSYAHAQHVTVYGKMLSKARGTVETWSFGSTKSDSTGTLYAKQTERLHQLLKDVAKNGVAGEKLRDNVVRQYLEIESSAPVVRIEVRLRKLSCSVADLADIKNRFLRFIFIEREDTGVLSKLTRLAFRSMCRDIGLKATLDAFKGHPKHKQLVQLSRARPDWWKPKKAWREAIAHPVLTKVFSAPAGVDKKWGSPP